MTRAGGINKKHAAFALLIALIAAAIISTVVTAGERRVFDQAGLFSEQEIAALEQRISALRTAFLLDLVIVTSGDLQGKKSQAYADDFYDFGGFGVGSNYDGLLLLINMEHRDVYISTTGIAIDIFTDARIEAILDNVYPHLTGAAYFSAGMAFLNDVSRYAAAGIPEGQYRVDESETSLAGRFLRSLSYSPVYILLSMAVGAIAVGIMAAKNRGTARATTTAYLDQDSMKVLDSRDTLVNTSVTKTKIQQSSSGGSGSGFSGGGSRSTTHRSSSGRTHGGGGRKF